MMNNIIELITEKEIDKRLQVRNIIRIDGMPNKEYGFELTLTHFLKLMYADFTPQSYGTRVQNRFIEEYNLVKVPSCEDKGDVKNKNNKYGEIKVSYKNTDGEFNFVQIRPHQKCNFYLLIAINPDENFKYYTFFINENDINSVIDFFKASNCHGVSKNKKDKSQEELRFTVKFGSNNWNYLINNFLTTDAVSSINEL